MAIHLSSHAFAANPLRSIPTTTSSSSSSPTSAVETLKSDLVTAATSPPRSKVLPFRKGRPLASSPPPPSPEDVPRWRLAWLPPAKFSSLPFDAFVWLGSGNIEDGDEELVYWAVDVSEVEEEEVVNLGGVGGEMCFLDLRTLMVATDWADADAMGDLAIAGHARALLEWHNTSKYCGNCGSRTVHIDAGRRKQCTNESCKKRVYPRVDPVVIMLVIDKANDRALLSHQSRFVPRLWSCLAGFIEPGESLEEAVRRETWEETGIEVGEVVYHSSQPWPVGPNSMPCQLMVGFFGYAKSFEIRVDKKELEDAQWHSREDIKRALTLAEYEKAQRTNAIKVNQMCKGVEKGQNMSSDFNVESGEMAPMFVPGPFAIAHHLISTWVYEGVPKPLNSASSL